MKRTWILVLIIAAFMMQSAKACDICGCGVGSSYVGMLPEFQKHIIGLRFRYNTIATHVGIGGASTYLTTQEYYRTTELWAGLRLASKWRLLLSVPYNFNRRANSTTSADKSGPGDMTGVLYYQAINAKKTTKSNRLLINSLWLGGGVKLPVGKYNPVDKNTVSNNNLFQLGTGSTDFFVAAMYDVRLQDAGLSVNSNYKVNTANSYRYQYGDKFTLSSQLYYKFRLAEKLTVAPNAGIVYETAQSDLDNSEKVDVSGGNLLMRSVGVEATFKKLAIGMNWQAPIHQNLAMSVIKAGERAMVHVSFVL